MERLKEGDKVFPQDSFGCMVQLKQAQVKQPNGLRLMMQGLHQLGDDPRKSGTRMLVTLEPPTHFLTDSQSTQAGFGCRPEEVTFSREVAENGDFADASQPGDFIGAAGCKALAREQLNGRFYNTISGIVAVLDS